jgi:hypothetical protein
MKNFIIPFREMKIHNWVRICFGPLITMLSILFNEYGMMLMGGPLLLAGFFGRRGCHGEVCEI